MQAKKAVFFIKNGGFLKNLARHVGRRVRHHVGPCVWHHVGPYEGMAVIGLGLLMVGLKFAYGLSFAARIRLSAAMRQAVRPFGWPAHVNRLSLKC